MNRKTKRHLLVPILAAIFGGVVVIVLEWTVFRSRPVQLPVIVGQSIQQDQVQKQKINYCEDLHGYVCSLSKSTRDPTGDVRRDSEGEVEALRIYEQIIRSHPRASPSKIDELLVRKIYSPSRTKIIRELFKRAKEILIQFIDSQPFRALSEYEKEILKDRVEKVQLELPPPATVYADEPDLFTRNDVYYERTVEGNLRIRMGGALFFTVKSQFNLAFTLSHELAHSIDPCELNAEKINILAYRGLSECFGAPYSLLAEECSPSGKLSEIFADWAATHVVAQMLAKDAAHFTPIQLKFAVFNSVRDLCRDDDTDLPGEEMGLSSGHPQVAYRVNRIFAQHPKIRKFLGCEEQPAGPTLPGIPTYCFWSSATPVTPAPTPSAAKIKR